MVMRLVICSACALVASITLQGCGGGGGDGPVLRSARGSWQMMMSYNGHATYELRYGWHVSNQLQEFANDGAALSSNAMDIARRSLTVAGSTVAPNAANQLVEYLSPDMTMSTSGSSTQQTFSVEIPDSGGYVWQWKMQFSVDDDGGSAELKCKHFRLTHENRAPTCLPGQFAHIDEPFGECTTPPPAPPPPPPTPSPPSPTPSNDDSSRTCGPMKSDTEATPGEDITSWIDTKTNSGSLTWEDCQTLCRKTSECTAWVITTNWEVNQCWIKRYPARADIPSSGMQAGECWDASQVYGNATKLVEVV